MKFDKLTIKSQEAVAEAQAHASSRGHTAIEPAHLGVTSLATAAPAFLPLIYLNAVAPGLIAGYLLWAGDRRAPGRGRLRRRWRGLTAPAWWRAVPLLAAAGRGPSLTDTDSDPGARTPGA